LKEDTHTQRHGRDVVTAIANEIKLNMREKECLSTAQCSDSVMLQN